MIKTLLLSFQLLFASILSAQSELSQFSLKQQEISITEISRVIEQNYVFLPMAAKIKAELNGNFKNGKYKNAKTKDEFIKLINQDLYAISNDKHLRISNLHDNKNNSFYNDALKSENFGFQEVKIFPGNIGYINIKKFVSQMVAGETAKAAMQFVSNTDALIIDLCDNFGGSSEMNQFLLSYFFNGEHLQLAKEYIRKFDAYREVWTLDKAPGKFYNNDIFVLVNSNTYSAAEQFAFILKAYKRATIIGETTGGAANGGKFFDTEEFNVFIPTAHFSFPVDDSTWENVGVEPDIVAVGNQLAVAQTSALSNLVLKYPDKVFLQELLEKIKK